MRERSAMARLLGLLLVLAATAMLSAPARAQGMGAVAHTLSPKEEARLMKARAKDVVRLFKGKERAETLFTPDFLTAVPPATVAQIVEAITADHGRARRVQSITPTGPLAATLTIEFDRSFATANIVLEPTAPHRIAGLRFTDFRPKKATKGAADFDSIARDFAKLPGAAGFAVAEITPTGIVPVADYNAGQSFGIGSTFKLYILAELTTQVAEGKRRWDDVVPLNYISVPSGVMQDWPRGTPVTLLQLASHMISISDNTATDTLLFTLGRDSVTRSVLASGHSNPAAILPMFSTREFFAMKMPEQDGLRAEFLAADEAGQAALLDNNALRLANARLDGPYLSNHPRHIDTMEWFATPADVVLLLAMLHRMDNPQLNGILAQNQGLAPSVTGKWRYLGFKGGSEAGVINLSFLGQRPDGRWFAITGSWNNTADTLNEARFVGLMTRLLNATVEGQGAQ